MGIIIIGLGPGDGKLLTRDAWDILTSAEIVYLRTSRHPVVADFPDTLRIHSFDEIYETADNFEEVYDNIANELLTLGQSQDVIYAVPGHPHVGESTVSRIIEAAADVELAVRIVPGLSFVEPVLSAVGIDALDGLQIFDALAIAEYLYPPVHANAPLLLAQVYNRFIAASVKMSLLSIYPDQYRVYLIHAAGGEEETVEELPLYAIDRSQNINHLTSLFVPALVFPATLPALAETVAVLRSPDGCPWDIEQTPESMREGFLEEAYEVLDAIGSGDVNNIREELGDLLYHIVMQAQMASESGDFNLTELIAGIEAKLKRRHPHVWGDWDVNSTAEVLKNWEMLKKEEKKAERATLLEGIPEAMPSLARSQKIQKLVAQVGFDWPELSGIYEKIDEETAELQAAQSPSEREAEMGDLLFVLVNLARRLGVDAEIALREANRRFATRFTIVEQLTAQRGLKIDELDLSALDAIWEEAKELLAKADADAKV